MKLRNYSFIFIVLAVASLFNDAFAQVNQKTIQQIQLLLKEKESRTPAQQKMSSQLLQAIREKRGQKMAEGVNLERANVNAKSDGRVEVDISADVTDELLNKIKALGGEIFYPSKQYHTVRALIKLTDAETIAGFREVKFIEPAAKATTVGSGDPVAKAKKDNIKQPGFINTVKGTSGTPLIKPSLADRKQKVSEALKKYLKEQKEYNPLVYGSGSINSEGDRTHRADDVRNTFGYAGQGIKIGVMSDSYNSLGGAPADVASGNLPGTGNPLGNTTPVTVLQDYPGGSDEGRAMMQIVHDLAPKAQLYYATAFGSPASFAANIIALRNAGCDIIIDDVFFSNEPAFQDGIIAQAVNTVTAAGALYFSSAGNSGSVAKGTGGAYEADFNDAGSPAFTGAAGKTGTIHNFGTLAVPVNGDIITAAPASTSSYFLKWADPIGGSGNDYDLFLISSAGTIKASSTNIQSGAQDPFEQVGVPTLVSGDRLVVYKTTAAATRAFHLNANRGKLTIVTTGQTHGHSSAANSFSVAATPAAAAANGGAAPVINAPTGPFPGAFTTGSKVEYFSSDGPRRIFYNADSTPVTPGNFLIGTSGGTVRQKPDITAADGVATTLPSSSGLNPFYGTSAAAPHAGAIAALIKSANPALTPAQIRTILISNALDIEGSGVDNVSGAGIVQAFQSMQALNPTPLPYINLGTTTITESYGNANGIVEPGEVGNLVVQLNNSSLTNAANVTATVISTTAGITITQGTVNYGTINSSANASNSGTPFKFGVNSSVACGTVITFQIKITFTGGAGTVGYPFTATIGTQPFTNITSTLGAAPPSGAGFTSVSGQQTGRLVRTGTTAVCGTAKANPGLTVTTGARQYDAYTFTNTNLTTQCVTVTLNSNNAANVYSVAYTGSFVPANPSTNYLSDDGIISASTHSYSFNVASGVTFVVVVHDINVTPTSGAAYTLNVSLANCSAAPACTPVTITTASIASGATGSPYSQSFATTGGSGTYVFSLTGNLPAGVSFSGNTLSGTPTQAGSFSITVTATDPTGCPGDSKNYTLVISGIPPTSVTATAGTPQSSVICGTFATSLQATVKDAGNNVLSGVDVKFTAPISGASGTFTGGVTTITVVTDVNGIASASFTANSTVGSYIVTAAVNGVGPVANFNLTNSSILVTSNADSGPGTLRDAINNACPGATITFSPAITQVNLTSGELLVTNAITIIGTGANLLTISAGNLSRVLHIAPTSGTSTINISAITFRDGKVPASSDLGGAGILIDGGIVNITGCVISNNDVTAMTNGFSDGGGIYNGSSGLVTVDRSTINNNLCIRVGGGIANWGTGGMVFTNSTISANQATGVPANGIGGGLFYNTTTTMTNCTVFANSGKQGGNVARNNAAVLTFKNSIIAGGTATTAPDISSTSGGAVSANYNLIQTTTGATITGTTTNNVTGQSPNLMPLGYYGGPTPTLLPMPGSPAINVGDPALTSGTDQRGFARLVGAQADIGSVEATAAYYSKATGNLEQQATWGTNADGTGTPPVDFISPNQLFSIRNNASPVVSDDWTVSGANSSVLAGDGANALTLTVAATKTMTVNTSASLSIQNNASVIFNPASVLTVGAGSVANFNNKPVTFKSDVSGTARLAQVSGTLNNAANVTIQRYIPAKRAWRLMNAPLTASNTINASWQNGGTNTAGIGTFITGTGTGLDAGTASMKTFNTTIQALENVTSTSVALSSNPGYFIFIRGDRNPANLTPPASNITTLSAIGSLVTGPSSATVVKKPNAGTPAFTLVGNPYMSPINFASVTKTLTANRFYVWDPKLAGVGGYVTFDGPGYLPTVGGGSYTTGVANSVIESSQSFFVESNDATTDGSLGFAESNKVASNQNVFRQGNGTDEKLNVILQVQQPDNSYAPADGVFAVYENIYSTAVTSEDASKIDNIGENLSILREARKLSIEKRPLIDANDTVFLKLENTSQRNYKFIVYPTDFNAPLLSAYLEDAFTGISTPLSLSAVTNVEFAVTSAAASFATDRFRIVFKTSGVLPVSITTVKAYQKNAGIQVDWNIATESNMKAYEVEKSTDGRTFSKAAAVTARANNSTAVSYNWFDANPVNGVNYYRIKAMENSGTAKLSQVVSVKIGGGKSEITVYPNPVTDNSFSLQFTNEAKGTYIVQLFNSLGQQVYSKTINHQGGSASQILNIGAAVSKGVYQLKVSNGENKISRQLVVE